MANVCIFPFCKEEPSTTAIDGEHVCATHDGEHTADCKENPCEACESAAEDAGEDHVN